LLNPAMKFVLGGARSAPPKTNFIATISNAQFLLRDILVLKAGAIALPIKPLPRCN